MKLLIKQRCFAFSVIIIHQSHLSTLWDEQSCLHHSEGFKVYRSICIFYNNMLCILNNMLTRFDYLNFTCHKRYVVQIFVGYLKVVKECIINYGMLEWAYIIHKISKQTLKIDSLTLYNEGLAYIRSKSFMLVNDWRIYII